MKAKKIVARVILVGSLFFIFGFSGALYIDLEKPENTQAWSISQLDVSFGAQAYAESGGRESGKKSSKKKYKKESGKYEKQEVYQEERVTPQLEYIIGGYSELGDTKALYSYGVEGELEKGSLKNIILVDYPKNPHNSLSQTDIEHAFKKVVSEKNYNIYSELGENEDAYGLQKALDSLLLKANIQQDFDVEFVRASQKKEKLQEKAKNISLILEERISSNSVSVSQQKYQAFVQALSNIQNKQVKGSEIYELIGDVLVILENDIKDIIAQAEKIQTSPLTHTAPNGSMYIIFQGPDGNYRFQRENKTIGDVYFSSREEALAYIDTNAVATSKKDVSSTVSTSAPAAVTPTPKPTVQVAKPAPKPTVQVAKPAPKPTVQVAKPAPAPAPTYKKVDKKTRAS